MYVRLYFVIIYVTGFGKTYTFDFSHSKIQYSDLKFAQMMVALETLQVSKTDF